MLRMGRIAPAIAIVLWTAYLACAQEPAGLLDEFLPRMRAELQRLPDFVCTHSVERFTRAAADKPWERIDAVRYEVAMVGDQELYGLPGTHKLESRPPAQLAGRGSISTGQLGLFARHLFLASRPNFTFSGETDQDGRRAYEYKYDIAPAASTYRLRTAKGDSIVGFQGALRIDARTMDLLQLDVQAYDIPDALGLAEADTSLKYARMDIDGVTVLLPSAATLTVTASDGAENMNRTRLTGCRHYRAESSIAFNTGAGEADRLVAEATKTAKLEFSGRTTIDLALDAGLDPASAKIGDAVRATVVHAVKDGERIVIPEGAVVSGQLVGLEKSTVPFTVYQAALQFDTVEMGGRRVAFAATMIEAGPASGLLKQSKHLDPTFTKRRESKLNILVREIQRGQGILDWDGRRGAIPRGLRMKWLVEQERVR